MPFADARAALAALADGSASPEALREIVTAFPQLRPVVAAYPGTDDPLLAWLGGLGDPAVDAQLAKRAAGTPDAAPEATVVAAPTRPVTPPEPQPGESVRPAPADQPLVTGIPAALGPSPTVVAPTVAMAAPSVAPQPAPSTAPQPAPGPVLPPTAPPTSPSQPTPPSSGRRWPVVVAVVGALVLLGGGVGAAFATGLLGGSASGAPSVPPPERSTAPELTPSTEPTPDPSGVPSATPSQSPASSPAATSAPPSTAPAGLTCWDGSAAAGDCPQPADSDAAWRYLQYVFPSIATHSECTPMDSTGKADYTGFTVMWDCELGDALLRYRFWEKASDATGHYGRKFNAKSTRAVYDVLIGGEPVKGWLKTDKDTVKGPGGVKRVVATLWLPDQRLSLSIEGNSTKALWAAFDQVRIRPVDQVLGHPANETPGEAPITALPS